MAAAGSAVGSHHFCWTQASSFAHSLGEAAAKNLINAAGLLAGGTEDGRVGLGDQGNTSKRTDPAFSAKVYRHAILSGLVRIYPDLLMTEEPGTGFRVA